MLYENERIIWTSETCFCYSVQMPSKPVRTLEEREAAYAEARLRILGSAVSSDDEVTNNSCDHNQLVFYVFVAT